MDFSNLTFYAFSSTRTYEMLSADNNGTKLKKGMVITMLDKKTIAEMIAAAATKAAKKACGSASLGGMHQIKEPQAVREFFGKDGKV